MHKKYLFFFLSWDLFYSFAFTVTQLQGWAIQCTSFPQSHLPCCYIYLNWYSVHAKKLQRRWNMKELSDYFYTHTMFWSCHISFDLKGLIEIAVHIKLDYIKQKTLRLQSDLLKIIAPFNNTQTLKFTCNLIGQTIFPNSKKNWHMTIQRLWHLNKNVKHNCCCLPSS